MANTLIACGGTGAHVALAFLRLHALGDPLGFFRHVSTTGKRMELPDLYLVDQDSGDGADEAAPTAWQTLRRVLGEHPSRFSGGDAKRWPVPREVTPLPVGADKALLTDGITTLGDRYPNSKYLNCILSAEQREIDFSRGMMGSPAVGASLFKLKSFDTRPDDPDINHDEVYNQMLGVKGRIAVAGSGVGGTGAAVGPTLARELSDSDERHVMAVMLLNWFEFDELNEHLGDDRIRAQRRNREMSENAHSGLRYYGNRLAAHAATVPVGIPRDAIESRRFTGDNHQPVHEVYPHAAAAICCLRQFLDEDAYSAGLYHLDAERPTALGPGTGLPGGGTVGDLASQGRTLVATLKTYENVLASTVSTPVAPILRQLVGTRRQATSRALAELRKQYSENLDWLRKVTSGTPTGPRGPYTSELAMRQRLANHPLGPAGSESPDRAAAEVFRWLARWIRDTNDTSEPTRPSGVYWPEIRENEGLTPSPREAGALQKVQADKVRATLDSFVDPELMSQNGWPDPVAAADYFRESLADGRSADVRRLELLFAGLLAGELILRGTARGDHRAVSLGRAGRAPPSRGPGRTGALRHRTGRREGGRRIHGARHRVVSGAGSPGIGVVRALALPDRKQAHRLEGSRAVVGPGNLRRRAGPCLDQRVHDPPSQRNPARLDEGLQRRGDRTSRLRRRSASPRSLGFRRADRCLPADTGQVMAAAGTPRGRGRRLPFAITASWPKTASASSGASGSRPPARGGCTVSGKITLSTFRPQARSRSSPTTRGAGGSRW